MSRRLSTSGGLVVRPSIWKLLLYIEIGLVFIVAGAIMLLLPASQIHPTALNPEPPAVVRVYGLVALAFGLVAVYVLVRLATKVVVAFDGQTVRYPRGGYVVPLADILRAKCYPRWLERENPAQLIALWLKSPERYREKESWIDRWGAEELQADMYLNLGVASGKDFRRVCEALEAAGVPVERAVYEKHSLKELREKWGDFIGFQVWLSERTPLGLDVALFTLMIVAFALFIWPKIW